MSDFQPYRAVKMVGSYRAEGTVVSEFQKADGQTRLVFEFDTPPGLLHVFRPDQVVKVED